MKTPVIFSIGGATFDIFVRPMNQAIMTMTRPDSREAFLCLPYGGKVRVEHVSETFGGGGTNTSVGFARLGFEAYCVGMAGEEYGDRVLDNLKTNGVNTKFVQMTSRDKTAFSVIINTFDGDRTVLSYSGANRYFEPKHLPLKALATADWIYLNHLSNDTPRIPELLLKLLKAHPHLKLAWNPGYEQLKQGMKAWAALLKHTTVLFLNKEEAVLFSGLAYRPAGVKRDDPTCHVPRAKAFLPPYADDVSALLRAFAKAGVGTTVITDGRNGAQATDGRVMAFCPVVSHKRLSTLGAGDAFGTGFVGALALGKPLKDALIYGTLNANSVVGQYGAQPGLLTRKALENQAARTGLCVATSRF